MEVDWTVDLEHPTERAGKLVRADGLPLPTREHACTVSPEG
jgi:hypothetical protein